MSDQPPLTDAEKQACRRDGPAAASLVELLEYVEAEWGVTTDTIAVEWATADDTSGSVWRGRKHVRDIANGPRRQG